MSMVPQLVTVPVKPPMTSMPVVLSRPVAPIAPALVDRVVAVERQGRAPHGQANRAAAAMVRRPAAPALAVGGHNRRAGGGGDCDLRESGRGAGQERRDVAAAATRNLRFMNGTRGSGLRRFLRARLIVGKLGTIQGKLRRWSPSCARNIALSHERRAEPGLGVPMTDRQHAESTHRLGGPDSAAAALAVLLVLWLFGWAAPWAIVLEAAVVVAAGGLGVNAGLGEPLCRFRRCRD